MKTDVTTKNFAQFGVFDKNGSFITSGSLIEAVTEANRMAVNGDDMCKFTVSEMVFSNEDDIVKEGTQILIFSKHDKVGYEMSGF